MWKHIKTEEVGTVIENPDEITEAGLDYEDLKIILLTLAGEKE